MKESVAEERDARRMERVAVLVEPEEVRSTAEAECEPDGDVMAELAAVGGRMRVRGSADDRRGVMGCGCRSLRWGRW